MKNQISLKTVVMVLSLLTSNAALADIKNSQDLLGGLLTRAGVKGRKPLSEAELKALCERGYTEAYFLYKGASSQVVSCSKGSIRYRSIADFRKPENLDSILNNISAGMRTGARTFVHCHNGAHASGYVGAIALRTFCGKSGDYVVNYWDRNLGGYPLQEPNRSRLLKRIREYPVRTPMELSRSEKAQFGCPN